MRALIKPEVVKDLKKDSMIEVIEKLEIPKYKWPFLLYLGRKQMARRLNEVKPFSGIDEVLLKLHKDATGFLL
ncbi:MAG: hypothetical protein WDN66_00775 [Candidatus Saccharibacteria bacterium]